MDDDPLVMIKIRESTMDLIRQIGGYIQLAGRAKSTNRATRTLSVDQVVANLARQWWKHRERGKKARRKSRELGTVSEPPPPLN